MKNSTIFGFLLFGTTACVSRNYNQSEVEMISNTPDNGAHPEIGFAVSGTNTHDGSKELCTVTLIRPQYVVTASHCIGHSGPQVTNGPYILLNNHSYKVVATNAPQEMISMRYCFEKHGTNCQKNAVVHDFAVMKLDRRVTDIAPARVGNTDPQNVVIYGYGCKDENGQIGRGQGRMYRGSVKGGKLSLICTGDSGGPVYDQDNGAVVRLMSQGARDHPNDSPYDWFARVGDGNILNDLISALGN